jgi:TAK1-binding protein 2
MDQMMPSKSIDQHQQQVGRIDQNNNGCPEEGGGGDGSIQKINACACSNISIMQLFHEMKQEFPKVPDHVVQQLVAENCHNRRACLEKLQKVAFTTSTTPTMYPSKSIHSETPRSPLNGVKWSGNKRMRELSEKFESTSINSSSSSSSSSEMTSPLTTATLPTSNDIKIKRPTTLPLRRAPEPPPTTSVSSISSSSTSHLLQTEQMHHNVTLDSTASKINDSLNVQLNVTVSPISAKSPIIARRPAPPPPPVKPTRFTSQLSVQPEPPFTSMIDHAKGSNSGAAGTSTSSGKKSFTKVNFTLRQPTSIIPSPQAPIEIQAGPQSLTYSSTSFNAKQGYESHLTITVAGSGESCIQAVRTLPTNSSSSQITGELNQIDTTINIEGSSSSDDNPPIRIIANPYSQLALPTHDNRLIDGELFSYV